MLLFNELRLLLTIKRWLSLDKIIFFAYMYLDHRSQLSNVLFFRMNMYCRLSFCFFFFFFFLSFFLAFWFFFSVHTISKADERAIKNTYMHKQCQISCYFSATASTLLDCFQEHPFLILLLKLLFFNGVWHMKINIWQLTIIERSTIKKDTCLQARIFSLFKRVENKNNYNTYIITHFERYKETVQCTY